MYSELKLWKYSKDLYYGKISGLFISTEEEINKFLLDRTIYFGEVLGRHSEVSIDFKKDDFIPLRITKEVVQEIVDTSRNRTISGYNPFEYVDEEIQCTNCGFTGELAEDVMSVLGAGTIFCPICESKSLEVLGD